MEPNARTVLTRGSLGGERVAMEFDQNSIAHIMSVLTDLYSDPELAVLREYSTNAADSHIAAGQTRPIEITLPGDDMLLKIKDFGLGLSVDDITNVYSKYGASTKRGTNDQQGMLGLGCKSALTYTNQFNVISVMNGVRVSVSVSRIEDGTGVMEIVDTAGTNEPNGVEIRIPVKRYNNFNLKAAEFFKFWPDGSVLINGQPPQKLDAKQVSPGLFMVNNINQDYVVMGNVAYPTEASIYSAGYYQNFHVVAFVPIGDVDFTPSREALQYTKKTKATIERLSAEFKTKFEQSIRDDINAAPTKGEAVKAFLKWRQMMGNNIPKNLLYRGVELPETFKGKFTVYDSGRGRNNTYTHTELDFSTLHRALLITELDWNKNIVSAGLKAKAKYWASQNNQGLLRYFVFTDVHPGNGWLDNVPNVTFDDLKAIKLVSATGPALRKPPMYPCWDSAGNTFVDHATPLNSPNMFYCTPADKISDSVLNTLTTAVPGATIVSLTRNRWDKFKREFPNAKQVNDAIREFIEAAAKKLTTDDKQAIALEEDYYVKRVLDQLDPTKIDDPEVVKFIAFRKGTHSSATLADYKKWQRFSGRRAVNVSLKNPLSKYPLINTGVSNKTHAYIYMNAVYKAIQDGKVV